MMFLNLLNRIFGPKSSLSREEIDAYKKAKGNLHAVEEKAAHSSFDQEALEGWEKADFSVAEGMETTDHKMEKFKKSAPTQKNGRLFTYALLVAACALFIWVTYKGNQDVKQQQKTQIAETTPKKNKIKSDFDKINTYKTITKKKQITASQLQQERQPIAMKKSEEKNVTGSRQAKQSLMDSSVVRLPIQRKKMIPSGSTKDQLVYHQAKEVFIHGLKNVDYRAYRNRPIPSNKPELSGVPASQDNVSSNRKEKTLSAYARKTKSVPYIDYLTQSDEYFSNGNYKKALKHYLTILKTYPEDVNANFYGGLCYYNLGQFEQAINLLKKSYSMGYGNFRQEAYWFIAKANNEQGKMLKTKYYLKKIIQNGGFYSDRAKEMLKQLEKK